MDTYRMELTVRPEFSPFTIGLMIADATAALPDEPFDYSFDPFWGGTPEIIIPLVYNAPGLEPAEVGSLTIYPASTYVCDTCHHRQFEADRESHMRTHVVTGGPVENKI